MTTTRSATAPSGTYIIMQHSFQSARRLAALAAIFALSLAFSADNQAGDSPRVQSYTAILIWGTDGPKPEDKDLKDVDGKLVEKFKKIFKWKNYHEVNRKDIELKAGEPKVVDLSPKCAVKLQLTEKEGMDVELLGEGKSVYKGTQSMPLKDVLIVAGDDKNATAWFVVLQPR
jgi:hypothetical protein